MAKNAYRISGKDGDGSLSLVYVETSAADSNLPRKASGALIRKPEVADLEAAAFDLQQQMTPVTQLAQTILSSLKTAAPGKIAIEFGVELGGSAGIPLITQGTAKANLKVSLTWESKADKAVR